MRIVREYTRVFKEQLEDRAKMTLRADALITQWMLRWAAMLVSRYLVGSKMGEPGMKEGEGESAY